ncbi:hypothetical protein MRB53_027699 [Persea americana]|uniref:Uncharacterized protein n=1 Tax=Persea americana TaxID=3435 RepID=A0ACC2LMH1_PERAE|nr:hypothetical protein MRB53_027699 [Persea americana]
MAHFLLVTLPAQGHINPTLQFAKRLIQTTGSHVTFATSVSAYRRMIRSPAPPGLSYASFSDGYDDGFNPSDDFSHYMAQLKQIGARTLSHLVRTLANEGRHITCIVYTVILGWVADVTRDVGVPSALLWIQPATVFSVYYRYFHGYDEIIKTVDKVRDKDPCFSIKLPRLPLLACSEIPSFLLPSDTHPFFLTAFKEQFEALDREENPRVLVNTFDALESDALSSVDGMNLVGVGPMIPSAFFDGDDASDTTFGGDLFENTRDYVEWLDSKPISSVVYISFGSIIAPSKQQMEEISIGLLESGKPFLWVVRLPEDGDDRQFDVELRRRLDGTGQGMAVPWCSQVEVLSHPATGCFVTHCGWNSTLESMAMGVPMVCFPKWTDQTTNAKLVEDVWKVGVRVKVNEDGVLEGGELKRCLEEVMEGKRGEEIRKNARKWRGLAREAAAEGGSSYLNIKVFVEEVRGLCAC